MKLPIKVYSNPLSACLDNTIKAVSKWMNRDYELIFMNLWDYNFHNINFENINKGEKFTAFNAMNEDEKIYLLEKYHGIKIIKHLKDDFNSSMQNIITELNNEMPVSIYMDSYFCPWFKPKYKRLHSDHFCLVTGLDSEKKGFWISDGQMAVDGDFLSYDEYSKGFGSYFTYNKLPLSKKNDISCNEVLSVVTKGLIEDSFNAFDEIRKFSNVLKENIQYYDIWKQSGIHEEFLISAQRIKGLSYTLKYLYKTYKTNELLNFSERLNVCSGKWMSIYGMYLKTFFLKENTNILHRICNKITEAADEDEKLYYDIKDFINGKSSKETNKIIDTSLTSTIINDYYFVNINSFFNNTGFSKNLADSHPEFSYGARHYLKESLPTNELWEKKNLKFKFPNIECTKYDNISCLGQEIPVVKDTYSYIMLLGSSEIGNQVDNIIICFEDGREEKITIKFSTWRSNEAMYKEEIMWCGKSHCEAEKNINMKAQNANIYGTITRLSGSNKIEKIKLPICPNIHIFAITFAK